MRVYIFHKTKYYRTVPRSQVSDNHDKLPRIGRGVVKEGLSRSLYSTKCGLATLRWDFHKVLRSLGDVSEPTCQPVLDIQHRGGKFAISTRSGRPTEECAIERPWYAFMRLLTRLFGRFTFNRLCLPPLGAQYRTCHLLIESKFVTFPRVVTNTTICITGT